jgi:hypothetical protein
VIIYSYNIMLSYFINSSGICPGNRKLLYVRSADSRGFAIKTNMFSAFYSMADKFNFLASSKCCPINPYSLRAFTLQGRKC